MTAEDSSSQVSQRLRTVLLLILIFGAVLALKLFYWQILRGPEMQERAADQTASTVPVYAKRGDIVTNDNVLLAKDVFRYNVYVNVPFVKQPEKLAADLAEILQKPRDSLLANFKMNPKERVSVAYLEPLETAQKINKYKAEQGLLNVELEIRPVRVYPNGSFAAAVVGYINGNRAASGGVELFMTSVLSGTNGSLIGRKNALSDFMPHLAFENYPAIDGAKVTLTIDSGMQRIIEQELEKAIRESRAESGSIIVMDPKTGAILALAVWPAADLNRFFEEMNQGKYGNQTVNALYQPGSVFKIITYAAGLDAGVITPSTCFQDEGKLIIPGAVVENANRVVAGNVCLVEALRQSLNVEAAKVALMLGTPRFYSYTAAFGFGSPTRVELGGELAGSVKRPGDGIWRDGLHVYNAFGQGFDATPDANHRGGCRGCEWRQVDATVHRQVNPTRNRCRTGRGQAGSCAPSDSPGDGQNHDPALGGFDYEGIVEPRDCVGLCGGWQNRHVANYGGGRVRPEANDCFVCRLFAGGRSQTSHLGKAR